MTGTIRLMSGAIRLMNEPIVPSDEWSNPSDEWSNQPFGGACLQRVDQCLAFRRFDRVEDFHALKHLVVEVTLSDRA